MSSFIEGEPHTNSMHGQHSGRSDHSMHTGTYDPNPTDSYQERLEIETYLHENDPANQDPNSFSTFQ